MARNGSGVYSLPAGSTVTNGDTSDATDINTPLADIETDLNTARPIVAGGTGATSASAARTNLGLAIGTDVQAYSADLATYASNPLTAAELGELQNIGTTTIDATQWGYLGAITAAGAALIDDASASAQRTTLGLGTVATLDVGTSANNVVQLNGSAELPAVSGANLTNVAAATLGTLQATTSGTAIDFTSIPSGTKWITINFNQVSLDGADNILVQIGDSGGIETTGYVSGLAIGTSANSSTSGMLVSSGSAAITLTGQMRLELMGAASFLWCSSHTVYRAGGLTSVGGGTKALSAELDRLRITTTAGSNNFDNGSINIMYGQ